MNMKLVHVLYFVTFVIFTSTALGTSPISLPDNCVYMKHESGTVMCQEIVPDFSAFNTSELKPIFKLIVNNCGPSVLSNQSFAGLDFLSILVINNCKLAEIETGTFYNLSYLLHLTIDGGLSYIPNGVFCHTPLLRTLLLRNNVLTTGASLGFESKCPIDISKVCGINITTLSIANNDYTEITNDMLCSLPYLETFNASNNRITKIGPLAFSKLASLEVLDLSNNLLSILDPHLFKNTAALTTLYLSNNKLDYIPSFVFKSLTNLTKLYLNGNEIIAINKHAFSTLPNLVELDVSSNLLTKIDSVLSSLSKLTTLHLDNNELTTLSSDNLFGLLNLNHLIVDNNSLTTISKDVFKYNPRLTILSMNNNFLTDIPDFIYARRLMALYVSNNNISTLSETAFQNCFNVFYLDFSNNNIGYINNVTFQNMTYLMKLDLSNNSISSIGNGAFDSLYSVKYLFLQNNNITFEENVYKDAIGIERMDLLHYMRYLLFLNLSTNAISRFNYEWFPYSLVYLGLSNNSITALPIYDKITDPTPHMHILDLSNNAIARILPSQFPPSLEKLLLHKNKILTVDVNSFVDTSDLEYLYLHNNLLTTLPQMSMGTSMPIVTLRENPWICDCKLSWLKTSINRPFLVYDSRFLTCQYLFNKTLDKQMPLLITENHNFLCDFKDYLSNHSICVTQPNNEVCRYQCPSNCTCYRDFSWTVIKIDCSKANLTTMPMSIPNITKSYYLDGNDIPTLNQSAFKAATFLKYLFLNSSKIFKIENGTFSFTYNLESLNLKNNFLKTLAIDVFKNLTLLKNLDLSFNQLADLNPKVFAPLKGLQSLNLQSNKLTQFPVWSFTELPAINSLGLNYNPWDCSCDFTTKYRDWLITHIGKLVNMTQLTCTMTLDNGFTKNISLVFFNTTHCFHLQPGAQLTSSAAQNHSTVAALAVCLTIAILVAGVVIFIYRRELKLRVERRFGTRLL